MTWAPPPAQQNLVSDPLNGFSVLMVEDQALIAMDAEEALTKLGAKKISSHPSVKSALASVAASRPDFAVLDYNLDGKTTGAIAAELMRLDGPFIFVTGYDDSVMIPDKFKSVPIVRKPISLRDWREDFSGRR